MKISEIVELQRSYFNSGKTLDINVRINALLDLKEVLIMHEDEILEALYKDLNKDKMEGYLTETSMVIDEINYAIKHIKKWTKKETVKTPISQFPSKSIIYKQPYGIVLILSPWNYPLQLCLAPLVGAIAAGNCAILKPSRSSKNTSRVIEKIINEHFKKDFLYCIEMNSKTSYEEILNEKYDYIMFTGSERIGKVVMESAAKHLTPVTLELGGKSPCIVDETADIKLAAKRIAWGKFLNAGQTCVAPDYVVVQKSVKNELVQNLIYSITELYGKNSLESKHLPKIINEHHFNRLLNLIKDEKVLHGGLFSKELNKINPTIVDDITFKSPIMQEEIFGPLLPIIEYEDINDLIDRFKSMPHPLALYLFTKNKYTEKKVIENVIYGGGCINDTIIHLANHNLPFGGVGSSGMGGYHGKHSFDTFSHKKSVIKKSLKIDIKLRYAPYSEEKLKKVRKILK
ncbi:aldehyde dehydrogenase [Sedimentibacter sp. zth1]|uniref:aldehyde dehydrogenase n=1 Tax=Sedimentibacter sp. zth1 TaxID=2816908 RepID=UPI001A926065|nr:aldehyde dehydrogenase [Sedimentibacter sp. zth1]QSX05521.1 aldehyde dehydrogenase [Sedimentibacter sp. zth1]